MPTVSSMNLLIDDECQAQARIDTEKGMFGVDQMTLDIMGHGLRDILSPAGNHNYCITCQSITADSQEIMHLDHILRRLPDSELKTIIYLEARLARIDELGKQCSNLYGGLARLNKAYGRYVNDMIDEQHKKFKKYFVKDIVDRKIGVWLCKEQARIKSNQKDPKSIILQVRGLKNNCFR